MTRFFLDRNGNYYETLTDVGQPPAGHRNVPQRPSADHQWRGQAWVFVPPPPPSPAETARRAKIQADRAALEAAAGLTLDEIRDVLRLG